MRCGEEQRCVPVSPQPADKGGARTARAWGGAEHLLQPGRARVLQCVSERRLGAPAWVGRVCSPLNHLARAEVGAHLLQRVLLRGCDRQCDTRRQLCSRGFTELRDDVCVVGLGVPPERDERVTGRHGRSESDEAKAGALEGRERGGRVLKPHAEQKQHIPHTLRRSGVAHAPGHKPQFEWPQSVDLDMYLGFT